MAWNSFLSPQRQRCGMWDGSETADSLQQQRQSNAQRQITRDLIFVPLTDIKSQLLADGRI